MQAQIPSPNPHQWLQQYQVPDLSRSIIREYLLQHNLTKTLTSFENEDSRTQKRIKKSVLIQILSMNNLVYFNKQSQDPYLSILDTLVAYLRDKFRMRVELGSYEGAGKGRGNVGGMDNSLKDSQQDIRMDKSLNNTVKFENQRNNKLINSKVSQAEKPKRPATSGHRVTAKNVQNIYAQLNKIDVEEQEKKKLLEREKQEMERKKKEKELEAMEKERKVREEGQYLERIRVEEKERKRKQEQRLKTQIQAQKQRQRKAEQQSKIQQKKLAEQREQREQLKKAEQQQKRKREQQLQKQNQLKRKQQQQQRKRKQKQLQQQLLSQRRKRDQQQKQKQIERERQKEREKERQRANLKQKQENVDTQQPIPQKQASKQSMRTGMRKLIKKKETQPDPNLKIEQEVNTSREKKVEFLLEQPAQKSENKAGMNTWVKKQDGQKMVVIGGKKKKNIQQSSKNEEKKFVFDDNFVDEPLRATEQKYVYEKMEFNKITLKNPSQAVINYRQKPAMGNKKSNQKPITQQLTQQLKKAVFQTGSSVLPKSWYQGFILSPHASTPYGLQQIQGGPCGIIAAIQCYFLKHLLHLSKPTMQELSNETLRQNCLVAAITDMLYKSKSSDKIVLALPPKSFSGLKLDISSFRIVTIEASTFPQAYQGIYQHKSSFIGKNNHGVAVLMYCMVMTKGIESIWSDMDIADNPLIGHHGHCTQQLVNLFITGYASSNIFDGITNLDQLTLKGIPNKSQFGFLTIYETNDQLHVGKNLKNPIYPFWIICKQFHYHVIFSNHYLIAQNNNTAKFDIVYFDGLYNCADRIVITLESYGFEDGELKEAVKVKDLPLIQQVMKTKWGLRKADWNGSIRIL